MLMVEKNWQKPLYFDVRTRCVSRRCVIENERDTRRLKVDIYQ
jgi:hypothetical protein